MFQLCLNRVSVRLVLKLGLASVLLLISAGFFCHLFLWYSSEGITSKVFRFATDVFRSYEQNITGLKQDASSANIYTPKIEYYVSQCPGNYDGRRIGNQLFNLAAALFVVKGSNVVDTNDNNIYQYNTSIPRPIHVNRTLAMPVEIPNGWIDQWFDLNITRYHKNGGGVTTSICPPCDNIGEEQGLSFSRSIDKKISDFRYKTPTPRALLVCGWFQSWKYTVGVEDELRRHLRFNKNITDIVDEFFHNTRPCRWKASECSGTDKFLRIGMHIRRSDITRPDKLSFGYTVPDRHYLRHAMEYFSNTTRLVQFVVVSDDIPWTKDAIKENGPVNNNTDVVFSSPTALAAVDLAILSRCDGVIMTTGTFGWWGAWLANKTTVYYGNWPKPKSSLANAFTKEDFFPPEWISMV